MLDLDKAKLITGSDSKTAQILGMSRPHFSSVRAGRKQFTPYQAAKLAELLGEPWHAPALARLAELAASEEEARFWRGKSETLRQTVQKAAMVGFLTIGAALLVPSGNAQAFQVSNSPANNGLFIAHLRRPMNGRRRKSVFRGADDLLRKLKHLFTRSSDSAWAGMGGLPCFAPLPMSFAQVRTAA